MSHVILCSKYVTLYSFLAKTDFSGSSRKKINKPTMAFTSCFTTDIQIINIVCDIKQNMKIIILFP